jgi:tetratricopeptide (TPR) repeat protein
MQLDPGYAPARAGAARAYVSLGLHGAISQSSARVLALTEARSALELNEQLPDAHFAQALILFLHDWYWLRAEQHYERSLQLNPSFTSARLYYAQLLAARQRFDEALEQITQAQLLDPQSPDVPLFSGMIRYYQRDYDSANNVLHRAAEQAPESAAVYTLLGRVAEARGRLDEALTLTRRASDLSGGGGGPLQVGLARLMLLAGQSDGATTLLATLERDLASKKLRMSARDLGYLRLAQGLRDDALDAFDQALDERDPSLVWLGVDPRLDPLRDQPRFIELLRKIGLP